MKRGMLLAMAAFFATVVHAEEPGTAASAPEEPMRKAGEWKVMMVGPDGQARAPHTFCFPAGSIDDISKKMEACSKRDVSKAGEVTTIDAVCKTGPQQLSMHMEIKAPTENAYSADMHLTYSPMVSGVGDVTLTTQAEFIGPCGANTQPAE